MVARNEDHDESGGQCSRRVLAEPQADQPVGERRRERRFADDAVQDADAGNADLDGREIRRRIFLCAQRGGRARVGGLRLQARRARRPGQSPTGRKPRSAR